MRTFRGSVYVALFLGIAAGAAADPLDQWSWRNPQPFNPEIVSIAHGNGLWLAVANIGLVATSPDGAVWDLASIGTNGAVSASAFGTNRFVVGSSKGVFVSTDGHSWSKAATVLNTLSDVAFGNGQFVGVSSSYAYWRSADGSTWISQNLGDVQAVFSQVDYVNGRYFILGYENSSSPTHFLYTSADAATWTGPVPLNTNGLFKVIYGNGLYLGLNQVLTLNGTWSEFRTSTDGVTWSAPDQFTNHIFVDAVFASGKFVVLDEAGRILTSVDGTNWAEQEVPELLGGLRIGWDGRRYLAAGVFGAMLSSTDGTNWVRRTTGPQNSLVGVTHAGGLYVAAGGNVVPGGGDFYSASTVATSVDGRNWSEHDPGTGNSLVAVAGGNGRFVAVGTNGTIVTSTDGTNWSAVASPTTNMLWGVAYGGGRFVAVGGNTTVDAIVTSTDGVNWTSPDLPGAYYPLQAITYAQGQFVAVGPINGSKQANLLTSPDGLVWTGQASTVTNALRAVTCGNGVFVAVGDRGTLVTSSDAVTWTNLTFNTVITWRGVAYGNGWYVAVGSPSVLGVSSNGVDWALRNSIRPLTLRPCYGIVAGDSSFLVVGQEGQVFESASFNPPAPRITLGLRQTDRPFLSFTGPEAHGYEIDGTDVLPPVWQTLGTVTNVSATTTLPVGAATNSNTRFYRVKLLN